MKSIKEHLADIDVLIRALNFYHERTTQNLALAKIKNEDYDEKLEQDCKKELQRCDALLNEFHKQYDAFLEYKQEVKIELKKQLSNIRLGE